MEAQEAPASLEEAMADHVQYEAPIGDNEDHLVDELMDEIHRQIVEEKYAELADDSEAGFDVLTEKISEMVMDDTEAESVTDDDSCSADDRVYENCPRSVGHCAVVVLLYH